MIELLEWLFAFDDADVIEELMPETGIEKMENGVFLATDINVDWEPVLNELWFGHRILILWIDITDVVPG